MRKASKFQSVLDAAKNRDPDPIEPKEEGSTGARPEGPRRGRPRGKRSDPAFEQVSVYVRKQTHLETKVALLQQGEGQEFSELVEELIVDWLRSHT